MRPRVFRLPWRTHRQIGDDVDEELRFHLDMRTAELRTLGMSPDAARAEAMRQFGDVEGARQYITNVDQATEAAQRRSEIMGDLRQDILYAARKLRSAPGFTLTVVLTLALGIGANTAIFSVVDGVLLRPLPFPQPERVTRVRFIYNGAPDAGSPPELADFRTRSRTMQSLAMYTGRAANLARDGADPQLLVGVQVSANWFNVLRITPEVGRTFAEGEDREGAPKVAVLSDVIWRRDFNADRGIVGRHVRINGEQVTVIGVIPAARGYPLTAEVWMPLVFSSKELSDAHRGARYLAMIGRLRDGVTIEQARRELTQIGTSIAHAFPDKYKTLAMDPAPLQDAIVGDLKRPLLVIMGAVAFVLLIACANVANLFLVRATSRESEMAVRTALGAGRRRLVRQLVTESVLLSLIGGVAGLLLATWGMKALLQLAPPNLPRVGGAAIDATALVITLLVTVVTGLVFGLLPATHIGQDVASALRAGARGTRTRHASTKARNAIVVAEVALAVTLLVGAGLLLRSFQRLLSVDPGFRPDDVLTFRVSLPPRTYASDTALRNFVSALDERLSALPGVRQAGISSGLPLDGSDFTLSFSVRGRAPVQKNEEPDAQVVSATPAFFDAIGIPLRRGRFYTREAQPGSPKEIVVSQEFVRRYFPNEDPLGRYVDLGWSVDGDRRGGTIIGIVGDVKQGALDRDTPPIVYIPYAQAPLENLRVSLRTSVPPLGLTKPARAAVRDLDRELPVFAIRPLAEYVSAAVAPQRFYAMLVGIFAMVALTLAAVGLYGVIAYAVSQRMHELGVRVALGATAQRIATMVVSEGLKLTLGGSLVGVVAAALLTRVLSALLFGVGALDPLTFAVVLLLLLAVAMLASYVPARRAARADPLSAMRGD
ncbi:MAG: ADOP family duplicated permease [Gemmatimonadaceae bacterium]